MQVVFWSKCLKLLPLGLQLSLRGDCNETMATDEPCTCENVPSTLEFLPRYTSDKIN